MFNVHWYGIMLNIIDIDTLKLAMPPFKVAFKVSQFSLNLFLVSVIVRPFQISLVLSHNTVRL